MRSSRATPAALGVLVRSWARLLAVLCVAGTLSTQLHYLFIQHTVCVEHGELIHGDVSTRHDVAHAPRLTSRLPAPTVAGTADEANHDHCGVVAGPSGCECDETYSVAVLQVPSALNPPSETGQHQPIAIVLLAPKTSPPV